MNSRQVSSSLIALAAGLWAPAALAQDAKDADAAGNREIIVTAQRRAESVQNVPITIAAFDEKMVEASGHEARLVPRRTTSRISFSPKG